MKKLILLFASGFFLFACNDDEAVDTTGDLTLTFSNLPTSASNEVYEGWVIVDGAPVSTGTFTVDANGTLSQSSFEVENAMLESAAAFVLSIEPVPDNDPAPSAIKILGGGFSNQSAALTATHEAALNSDQSFATGKMILATPTTETTEDELSGIWFLELTENGPMRGLGLSDLPSGWKYEGWAVIDGQPVTSGTFTITDIADESDQFSGPGDGPPFPGEDFVTNAPMGLTFPTDLSGMTVVISIEPNPDNDPAPFMFKPLVYAVPSGALDHVTYDMVNQVDSTFPSGTASW